MYFIWSWGERLAACWWLIGGRMRGNLGGGGSGEGWVRVWSWGGLGGGRWSDLKRQCMVHIIDTGFS